ncbi:ADP-ribosyl cyclase/cyclic ADP-ribose hydrolase-like [Ptychodera flava]|uniref:ADP-ribosyl cyclase/cyclic ADP-ribose hydrolase-like n=1 Tax=Ptychodera flava TaxID=63121 RepID=UPI00396A9BA1
MNITAILVAVSLSLLSAETTWAHMENYRLHKMPLSLAYGKNDLSVNDFCPEKGTTRYLKEVFIGLCWEHQFIYNRQSCRTSELKNCTELWDLFHDAFAYQSPCNVTSEGYQPFIDESMQAVGINKTLFWSGTFNVAHVRTYDNRQYSALEDTLPGYIAQMVTWCGQEDYPGINYDTCDGECMDESKEAYWRTASAKFASLAEGKVTVMLNGSKERGAFRNTSFFARYELPYLNPEKVTVFNVLVIHSLDAPVIEKCGEGSLLELEKKLGEYKLRHNCRDDPEDIKHILCSASPGSRTCQDWKMLNCTCTAETSRTVIFTGDLVLPIITFFTIYNFVL